MMMGGASLPRSVHHRSSVHRIEKRRASVTISLLEQILKIFQLEVPDSCIFLVLFYGGDGVLPVELLANPVGKS